MGKGTGINELKGFQGFWRRFQLRDYSELREMTAAVIAEILSGVAEIKGPEAAGELRRRGVERLHEVVAWGDIGPLREHVLSRLRHRLLAMAVTVGRRLLGWDEDFFVDDYLILRVNFPYEVARLAEPSSENPGTGRLSESVRELARTRKVIHPRFDPKGYHRHHPPAAWAHGPHRDSWVGHSQKGLNIWWAIGDVPPEAGMVAYPELGNQVLPCDPRTFFLTPGYALPQPTCLPLRSNELLVFNPQVLHGTHLNTSGKTRVAVTMRIDPAKPTFDPQSFYAHEFWRRAVDIEHGRDEIIHLRREDHLGQPQEGEPLRPEGSPPVLDGVFDPATGIVRVLVGESVRQHRRVIVEDGHHRLLLIRTKHGLHAFDAACPHYGVDLADGASDGDKLYCPACAVSFDLKTGESACPSLSLRCHQIWERNGEIQIRFHVL